MKCNKCGYDWSNSGDSAHVCGPVKVMQQEQGEPEMVRNMRMWVTALKSVSDNGQHMKIPSELSSGTCWELAVALEQFINTTPKPAQKPLTDEQIEGIAQMTCIGISPHEDTLNFARVIEAAHGIKEKNSA